VQTVDISDVPFSLRRASRRGGTARRQFGAVSIQVFLAPSSPQVGRKARAKGAAHSFLVRESGWPLPLCRNRQRLPGQVLTYNCLFE